MNNRSALGTRWFILALVFVSMTGVYYSYNIPAGLHQQLRDYMPPSGNFEFRFNLLYTAYSLPNVILPLFGGIFVDSLGAPLCFFGFALMTFLGQVLFAVGVNARSWAVMLVGRMLYGVGGESIFVAQSALLYHWFEGREVALAFTVAASAPGSALTDWVSPALANATSTPLACWVGVGVNMVSVCLALAINCVHKSSVQSYASVVLEGDEDDAADELDSENGSGSGKWRARPSALLDGVHEYIPVRISDSKRFGALFWLLTLFCTLYSSCFFTFFNVSSGILLERNYFTAAPLGDCTLAQPGECTSGSLQDGTNPATDSNGNACPVGENSAPVLPSSLNITRYDEPWEESEYVFSSITPLDVDCDDPFWSEACTTDYCNAQNSATEKAGRAMSVPYLMQTVLSPFIGYAVDRHGCRAIMTSVLSLMLMIVHIILALDRSTPLLPFVALGAAFALAEAVVWPSVPLTVEKKLAGTAIGTMSALQNSFLALYPLVVAGIYNRDGGYYLPNVEIFFTVCAAAACVASVALNLVDRKSGGRLNSAFPVEIHDKVESHTVEMH